MPKDKSPAYRWYPKDYEADEAVKLMTYEQEGIYRRLLDHQALHGGIPSDPNQIAMLVPKVTRKHFMSIWPLLASKFRLINGRLVNGKLEQVKAETEAYRVSQSERGAAKWGSQPSLTHRETRAARLAEARRKGQHTEDEWEEMRSLYARCLRCGVPESELAGGRCVKDHIRPIYRGGDDSIQNLQPLCRNCNSSKGGDETDHRIGLPETQSRWLPWAAGKPAGMAAVGD